MKRNDRRTKRNDRRRKRREKRGARRNDRGANARRGLHRAGIERKGDGRTQTKKDQVGARDRGWGPWPARRRRGAGVLHLHEARPQAPASSSGLYRGADRGRGGRREGG